MAPRVQGDATATPESSPEGGPYWSLMFEVSESELKPVNNEPESIAGAQHAPSASATCAGHLWTLRHIKLLPKLLEAS